MKILKNKNSITKTIETKVTFTTYSYNNGNDMHKIVFDNNHHLSRPIRLSISDCEVNLSDLENISNLFKQAIEEITNLKENRGVVN